MVFEAVKMKGDDYKDSPLDEAMHTWYLNYLKEPILEIGCGNGVLLEYLKENGFKELVGVDINEDLVKKSFSLN